MRNILTPLLNISLTIFLIKAAGIFEVKNTEKIIYEKTKSKNVTLRTEAYRSLGKLKAIEFELLWLKSKQRYYSSIKSEDDHRIKMLDSRLQKASI